MISSGKESGGHEESQRKRVRSSTYIVFFLWTGIEEYVTVLVDSVVIFGWEW
jgi:hypothetical protein